MPRDDTKRPVPVKADDEIFDLSSDGRGAITGEDLFGVQNDPTAPPAPEPTIGTGLPPRRRRGFFHWLRGLFGRS